MWKPMLAAVLLAPAVLAAAEAETPKARQGKAEIIRAVLEDKDTYLRLLKEGYVVEAPNLAGIYEKSPKDARFLAEVRKHMLVTGVLTRTEPSRGEIRALFLETGRRNPVVCELQKPAASSELADGSIISIYGLLEGGDGVRQIPAKLSQCIIVWSVPDVKAAAATALWCTTFAALSEQGKRVAVQRGSKLLAEVGLERPPLPCNMAFLEMVLQCLRNPGRRECKTDWASKVAYFVKAPNVR